MFNNADGDEDDNSSLISGDTRQQIIDNEV